MSVATVQTFTSFTSRPDVYQCLVVQTVKNRMYMSKDKSCTSLTYVACKSRLRFLVRSCTCGCILAQEGGWQSDVRPCIMPGLPMHLVQKIKCRHCKFVQRKIACGECNIFTLFSQDFRSWYLNMGHQENVLCPIFQRKPYALHIKNYKHIFTH